MPPREPCQMLDLKPERSCMPAPPAAAVTAAEFGAAGSDETSARKTLFAGNSWQPAMGMRSPAGMNDPAGVVLGAVLGGACTAPGSRTTGAGSGAAPGSEAGTHATATTATATSGAV